MKTPLLKIVDGKPVPCVLCVDPASGDTFIAWEPECGFKAIVGFPKGMRTYPFKPTLTKRGIEQFFEDPRVVRLLEQVKAGSHDAHLCLLESLHDTFFEAYEQVRVEDPWQYFAHEPLFLPPGEPRRLTVKRLIRQARKQRVALDPVAVAQFVDETEGNV